MSRLYRQSNQFPYTQSESLRDAFFDAALFLWAKGNVPTAEDIADAMMGAVVPVEPPAEGAYLQWVILGEIPEYAPLFSEAADE